MTLFMFKSEKRIGQAISHPFGSSNNKDGRSHLGPCEFISRASLLLFFILIFLLALPLGSFYMPQQKGLVASWCGAIVTLLSLLGSLGHWLFTREHFLKPHIAHLIFFSLLVLVVFYLLGLLKIAYVVSYDWILICIPLYISSAFVVVSFVWLFIVARHLLSMKKELGFFELIKAILFRDIRFYIHGDMDSLINSHDKI